MSGRDWLGVGDGSAQAAAALDAELAAVADELRREQAYVDSIRLALGDVDDPRETLDMARAAIARAERAERERDELQAKRDAWAAGCDATLADWVASNERHRATIAELRGALEETEKNTRAAVNEHVNGTARRALAAPPSDAPKDDYERFREAVASLPPMTPEERSEQRLDFAYGQLACTTNHRPQRAVLRDLALECGFTTKRFDAWANGKKWAP